jgi:uncharacterized phage protein (TIGR02220 family)
MVLELVVSKWEKYNPRSDVKSSTWLRLSNDFFSDPDFYGTPMNLRIVYLFILCAASKKMDNGRCKINTKMAADQLLMDEKEVKKHVFELISLGFVQQVENQVISTRSNPIESGKLLSATNERTDERTYGLTSKSKTNATLSIKAWEDWIRCYQELSGNSDGMTQKSKALIQALIGKSFTLEDCSLVVRYKHGEWSGDDKMRKYIRPQTLFSSKFETYLDEAKNRPDENLDQKARDFISTYFPGANLEVM